MNHASSLVFAGIVPHPPIMVPEVGRDAIAEVRASIDAMAELTQRLIYSEAETVVIISPHGPLEREAFIAYDGPNLHGDFSNFRAPTATVNAELDDELLNEITRSAANEQLMVMRIKEFDLDHGTAVPLYFLQRNGWSGKVIALGYNFLSKEDHVRFGGCIREAIENTGRRAAFIASGDLSHRLNRDAPAGYYPKAHLFDEEVVSAIRSCATERIVEIDQELRRAAGECGYRSMLVALGATQELESNCEVISYEAPFGVGYLVAQLVSESRVTVSGHSTSAKRTTENSPALQRWDQQPKQSPKPAKRAKELSSKLNSTSIQLAAAVRLDDSSAIPALARLTIETFVKTKKTIDPPEATPDFFKARAGCFVSIKTKDGDLRGCIGTVDPVRQNLADEIIYNAISAVTRDPRFPRVRADELVNLKYSVDVLSEPEPCTLENLDPKIYGVIVEHKSGYPRGLLLPNLPGIDTARQQIEIAARKAGLNPNGNLKIFRFRADRFSE